jgi:hypothetical protein
VVLVTPGWLAVRGWRIGREEPLSMLLTEWLPPALALGMTWSGALVLACGPRAVVLAARGPAAVRIATWLTAAGLLWLAAFALGWSAGRLSRRRRTQVVTVVLKSGAAITGNFHHSTETELTLADATMEARALRTDHT